MVCFCLFFYEGGESRAEFPVGQPLCSCDELNYLHVNNNRRILGIDFEFESRLKNSKYPQDRSQTKPEQPSYVDKIE